MLVALNSQKIDENSTEMDDLVFAGIKVGEYSHSLWSKWFNSYDPEKGEFAMLFEGYVQRAFYSRFKKSLTTTDDIASAIELLRAEGETFSSFAVELMEYKIANGIEKTY